MPKYLKFVLELLFQLAAFLQQAFPLVRKSLLFFDGAPVLQPTPPRIKSIVPKALFAPIALFF